VVYIKLQTPIGL